MGDNSIGQLGNGSRTNALKSPQSVFSKRVVAIGASPNRSFALTSKGKILAFGHNSSGQLGDGKLKPLQEPTPIDSITAKIKSFAFGYRHCLALDTSGQIWVWVIIPAPNLA